MLETIDSMKDTIDLCEGIEKTEDSFARDLIMIDIRNLHSSLTASWETTIRTIQVATLELAAFFVSAGVGDKLIPTYLPYFFISLMLFISITYFFFSFRLILSMFFDIRRDVLACKLGERNFLKQSYADIHLAPTFISMFFSLSSKKRFDRDVAIFNDPIMIGLFIVIVFFSAFEASVFYFYAHIFYNVFFAFIFSSLFFFLTLFFFRFIPKAHYKNFGPSEKNIASRKYMYIYEFKRSK
jgi:hypothetical protein